MIFTDRTVIVQKGTSSINDTIVLYRGDREVEIRFTLNESSPFKFGSGVTPNIIEKTEAAYGQLVIKTPGDKAPIFSEITATKKGAITFTITAEMIDEITEVGNYTFQIRLLDENKEGRVTIPEVVNGIEVREPIATEDISDTNEVGIAAVGYALTTAGTTEDTFDSQGNYNKTTWGTGDRITAAKLNKIEAGIDGVNKKVASGGTGGEGMTPEQVSQLSTAYQHSQAIHAPTNAEANVQVDWNEADTTSDAYIQNKPTNISEFANDANYASETYVANKIAEAQLGGGDSGTVDLSGYVTKETGNANQITFADGQTFQAKLDAGTLKGNKGDKGDPGSTEASGVSIQDTANNFTATNVEGALQEVGSQIKEIESDIQNIGNPTDEQISTAIKTYLASNPITIDNMWTDLIEGEIYEVQAPAVQIGISAIFTQGNTTIYEGSSVDSLKSMLVVTKIYNDDTTEVTSDYTLSGTLTVGTSTITVTNGTFTTTFDVTVSEAPTAELTSITAVYTQTSTVTPSTALDNLKSDIVVTANYSDGSTAIINDYTLNGTLTVGTSTITITYEGKTTTINVNVIADAGYTTDNLAGYYNLTGYADDDYGELYTGEDYTKPEPLYALDLTESSGVNSGLVARAYTRNTANLSDVSLLGFENGEFRSGGVVNKGGEGLAARIGINSIPYPFSIEWYGKFCGGMSSPTVDSKDTYDYPLNLFSSRSTIDNITTIGSKGSTLELKDSTTLSMVGGTAQGIDTMTLSKEFNKDVYHHFVVTYNNSLFQLYVDGEMLCSSTVTQNSNVSIITPMTNGVMKMLRVYKSVLSNTEVIRNYNDVLTTIGGGN